MNEDLRLMRHFVAELLPARHVPARVPEPQVMVGEEEVAQYRRATQAEGNGASAHLFNQLALSSVLRPGARVLDLACGPAGLLNDLASLHPQTHFTGVDLSPPMLALAQQDATSRRLDNVVLRQADITDLSGWADGSVDLVMSTLSLHHLPDLGLLERCIQEVARVVKPDGHVYLFDFASFKRPSTVDYFVHQRARDLEPYVAEDYERSLKAAFSIDVFRSQLIRLSTKLPAVRLASTFGVPFFVALTNIHVAAGHKLPLLAREGLSSYWARMGARQRKDFRDLQRFFGWGGLRVDPIA